MTIKSLYYKTFLLIGISGGFCALTGMEKEQQPASDESLYTAGISYVQQQKYKEAIECFDKIATESKDSIKRAYALYSLGLVYLKQERYKDAKSYFLRVLRFYSEVDILPLYNNLAVAYLHLGKREQAIEYLNKGRDKGDGCAASNLTNLIKERSAKGAVFAQESARKKRKPKKKKEPVLDKNEVSTQETSVDAAVYKWSCISSLSHTALEGHQDETPLQFVFCTADGNRLISLSSNYMYVWDTAQGTCIAIKELADKVKPYLTRTHGPLVGWNEKNQELFVVTLTGIIKVCLLDEAPFHLQMEREGKMWVTNTSCGTFNADCSLFAATVEHEGSKYLLCWDTGTGRMKTIAKGPVIGTIIALQFSTDSKKIYGVTKNGSVKVWNRESGDCTDIMRASNHEKDALSCSFIDPQGASVFLGRPHNLKLCTTLPVPLVKNGSEIISCVDWTYDGHYLACAYVSGEVVVVATKGQQQFPVTTGNKPLHIKISSDGSTLFVISDYNTVQVWKRFAVSEQISATTETSSVRRQPVPSTFIRSHCPSIRYGTDISSVSSLTLREDVTAILCESLTESDALIFLGDGPFILINKGGLRQFKLPAEHKGYIWSLCFLKDYNMLASGGDDCTVRLWDLKTNACRFVLKGHTHPVWSMVYDKTITALFTGAGDGTIHKWGTDEGALRKTLIGHTKRVNDMKLLTLNDGIEIIRALASCSDDGTIRIWDRKNGTCLRVFGGHTGPVTHIEYYSKYETLISASEDGTVRFWNIYTGAVSSTEHMSSIKVRRIEMRPEEDVIHIAYDDLKRDTFRISPRQPAQQANNRQTTGE